MSLVRTIPQAVRRGELRRRWAAQLRRSGIASAELDARVLFSHALGVSSAELLAHPDAPVPNHEQRAIEAVMQRRIGGEPVARIVGVKEFWSRNFRVTSATLVPRPETETVVEAALAAVHERTAAVRVLDLGTGSGVLLAAILIERPRAIGIGVDRSEAALTVARANLAALGLLPRTGFVCGDWTTALACRFDLVVVNPPYVPSARIATLPPEVRRFDPRLALDGGGDGLDAYRSILPDLRRLLAPGGKAVLELGEDQEHMVRALAIRTGLVVPGSARRDLGGVPRALVLALPDP